MIRRTSNPQLAPLGDYGGPTQTMHPLAGSPAILDTADTTRTDQRGFTLTGPPTIGAVKLGTIFTVLNNSETGADSLRDEIDQASNSPSPGAIIRFDPELVTNTITLGSSGQLVVPSAANGLFIDASKLPNGLTIDANQQSRVLLIDEDATAALHGLTLTGGRTSDGGDVENGGFGRPGENGGGILASSNSTLTLTACTVSGNQTGGGGEGVVGGTSGFGGGIFAGSNSTLSLTACTVSCNQTGQGGGGSSGGSGGGGGGIFASVLTAPSPSPPAPSVATKPATVATAATLMGASGAAAAEVSLQHLPAPSPSPPAPSAATKPVTATGAEVGAGRRQRRRDFCLI